MDTEPPIPSLTEAAALWPLSSIGVGQEPAKDLTKDLVKHPAVGGLQTGAESGTEGQEAGVLQGDRAFHALLARLTGGISPVALSLAYLDWAAHLVTAPERQMQIATDAAQRLRQLVDHALH